MQLYLTWFAIWALAWQGQDVPLTTDSPNPIGGAPNLRCGAEALYFGLRWLELPVEEFKVVEAKLGPPSDKGYSMAQLQVAAQALGATALGVETTLENLALRPEPLARIARLKSGHFVTIVEQEPGAVTIINPPAREIRLPRETFLQLWDGKVLLLSTQPIPKEEDLARPIPWTLVAGVGVGAILSLGMLWWIRRRKSQRETTKSS